MKQLTIEQHEKLRQMENAFINEKMNSALKEGQPRFHEIDIEMAKEAEKGNNPELTSALEHMAKSNYKQEFCNELINNFDAKMKEIGCDGIGEKEKANYINALSLYAVSLEAYNTENYGNELAKFNYFDLPPEYIKGMQDDVNSYEKATEGGIYEYMRNTELGDENNMNEALNETVHVMDKTQIVGDKTHAEDLESTQVISNITRQNDLESTQVISNYTDEEMQDLNQTVRVKFKGKSSDLNETVVISNKEKEEINLNTLHGEENPKDPLSAGEKRKSLLGSVADFFSSIQRFLETGIMSWWTGAPLEDVMQAYDRGEDISSEAITDRRNTIVPVFEWGSDDDIISPKEPRRSK